MKIISFCFAFLVFFSLVGAAVTGRKQWLIIWIWSIPALAMGYHLESGIEIDGLVVLICAIMSMEVAYSVWGVKLWCFQTRKKNRVLSGVVGIVNFILTYYCFSQSFRLEYFGQLPNDSKLSIFLISVLVSGAMMVLMQDISISTVEKYFSQKEEFALIHCQSTGRRSRKINRGLYRRYAIEGIQNGTEYVFYMTRKAYLILKQQKSFVFQARRGVLGGVYVSGRVYDKDSKRRLKRVNRALVRRGLWVVLLFVLAVILAVRIKTGMDLGTIFTSIGRGVMNWIK